MDNPCIIDSVALEDQAPWGLPTDCERNSRRQAVYRVEADLLLSPFCVSDKLPHPVGVCQAPDSLAG